jgi:hypothetical protein
VTDAVIHYQDYENAANTTQAAHVNAGLIYARHMLRPDEQTQQAIISAPVLTTLNIYSDEAESLLVKTDDVKERLKGLAS